MIEDDDFSELVSGLMPIGTPRPGVLMGQDFAVAAWAFSAFKRRPMFINRAIGLVNGVGDLKGAAIFSNHNGIDAELSLYTSIRPTVGMVRFIARFALDELHLERVTFHVKRSDEPLRRHLRRAGAVYEGASERYYGRIAGPSTTALRYALFAEQIARLACYRPTELN